MATLLSNRADRVLAITAPNDALRRIAENILRALTDLNADGFGIRRPQRFDELVAVCGGAEGEVRAILDSLRADGVSFVTPYSPKTLEEQTIIDVSHEAVIRCWDMIAASEDGLLIREFRDGQLWRSLVVAADAFASNPKNLLSEATTEARGAWIKGRNKHWARRYGGKWREVNELLEASRSQAKSARRRRQWTAVAFAGAGIMAVLFVIEAYSDRANKVLIAELHDKNNQLIKALAEKTTEADRAKKIQVASGVIIAASDAELKKAEPKKEGASGYVLQQLAKTRLRTY